MSKIVVLKVSDEDLNHDEGLDVIRQVLTHLGLRATVVPDREETRFWTIDNPTDENDQDMLASDLLPLVDEDEGGIVGYVIADHADSIANHLNGIEPTQ